MPCALLNGFYLVKIFSGDHGGRVMAAKCGAGRKYEKGRGQKSRGRNVFEETDIQANAPANHCWYFAPSTGTGFC